MPVRLLAASLFVMTMAASDGAPTSSLRISLQPAPPRGEVVLQRIDTDETLRAEIKDGAAALELADGTGWTLHLEAPGFWMPAETVVMKRSETPLVLARKTWRTGVLAVRLKATDHVFAKGAKLRVTVEESPVPGKTSGLPRSSAIDCPIAPGGQVACEVPAAFMDLGLRVGGFVPEYRWGVDVAPQTTLDLGTITLRKGASISGWVVSDEKIDLRTARVRLLRFLAGSEDPIARERLERAVAETQVQGSGFFQLRGIPEGTYRLIAEREASAPAVFAPLSVHANAETALRAPLRLTRPFTVRLTVTPATDWRGHPWIVRMERLLDYSLAPDGEPLLEAPVAADGSVDLAGQGAGTFAVTVSDSDGNALAARRFVVASETDATQSVEVDVLKVTGEVRQAARPVAATLWFGGQHGEVQVRARSDADGAFEMMLPHAGEWLVAVEPEGTRSPIEVEVDVAEKDGEAHVTIDLPRAVVTGRVVDDSGEPRQGARVTVLTSTAAAGTTGKDGSFRIEGVSAGSAVIRASSFANGVTQESLPLRTEIPAEGESGPHELRLISMKRVGGRVVSARGPIAGASVSVYRTSTGAAAIATTDLDGRFTFDVPAGDKTATLVVSPPGHALRAYAVPVEEPDLEVVVHAPDAGGTIRLTMAGATLVSQDGIPLAIQDLFRWAVSQGVRLDAGSGATLVLPNLSAGLWRFCLVGTDRCKAVTLAPNAEVVVDLTKS